MEDIVERIDKKDGVIFDFDKRVVSVPAGKFPIDLWKRWEKDCKERFNGCRWMKMWSDHLQAQQFEMVTFSEPSEETEQQPEVKEEKKEEKKEPETILGGKNDRR